MRIMAVKMYGNLVIAISSPFICVGMDPINSTFQVSHPIFFFFLLHFLL